MLAKCLPEKRLREEIDNFGGSGINTRIILKRIVEKESVNV
jgi:hypothetical protein